MEDSCLCGGGVFIKCVTIWIKNIVMKEIDLIKQLSRALGFEVGTQAVLNSQPTISVDSFADERSISVKWGESQELKRLKQCWIDDRSKWDDYLNYRKELETKYLPETFNVSICNLKEGVDIDSFKQGVGEGMWNTDHSHYSCDPKDIVIKEELLGGKYKTTYLVLKRRG